MKKNNCIFCSKENLEILEEGKNFLIKAEKFPIVRGSILIIPKKHYPCFGALPKHYIKELDCFQTKIKNFFAEKYKASMPIFMEHGIEGQTVFHAHLHCIPFNKSIFRKINDELKEYKRIDDFLELRLIYKNWGKYFFYQEENRRYVFKVKKLKPGYLRFMISEAANCPEKADWRKLSAKLFEKDVKALKKDWANFV